MSGRSTSFEIQFLRDKHWVVAEIKGDEEQAKAFADNLLQKGDHEAVRVVRDFARMDGLHAETIILEKTGGPPKVDLSLAQVAEAPVCGELNDFYGLDSRITIGRMCRKYLDEMVLTPTELLHSAQELRRFGDKDRLLGSGIDAVATLQARATGDESKVRRDFLHAQWEKITARARAATAALKPAADKSFAAIVKSLPAAEGPERDYLCGLQMARRLLETRSWLGKLDILIAWAAEDAEDAFAYRMIDGVIADIVVSAQMVQDLLGFQSNLGTALCHICDLVAGQAEAAKFSPPCFAPLNSLFAAERLPQTGRVLLTRVTREIRGPNPLSRNEPRQEYEMFHKVMHRLIRLDQVIGGPAAAEALVHRYAHLSNLSGGSVPIQAMSGVLTALSDQCRRVHFLLGLVCSTLAATVKGALFEALANGVRGADHIDAWVSLRVAPRDRMAALTATNASLLATEPVAEPERKALANCVDEALARYLVDEGIIEKIDKADDPLAMRAIRLIKFCGSGVLIRGKSMELARQRVIGHLRQPQFEEKFLASVPDPAQGEKYLRDFHRLLVEVGFG
ncbi:MAG TPA: hypothetical protein VK558_04140 [Patescibacteria group bacterium]|nr:hypothetical protein [Patescibacteria group bacterium]